tara:strand:+ start:1198 stop:1350 length:153 start_codon:yes stop_codon:yes gene_type:complete
MGKTRKHKPEKRSALDRKSFTRKGRRNVKRLMQEDGGESFERFYGKKKKK